MMLKGVDLLKDQGLSAKEEVVIIGDTLDTDIKGANDVGIRSILLRTGVHKDQDLQHYPDIKPTCIADGIGDVIGLL